MTYEEKYVDLIDLLNEVIPRIRGAADDFEDNKSVQEGAQDCLNAYDKLLEYVNHDLEYNLQRSKHERTTKTDHSWRFEQLCVLLENIKDFSLQEGVKDVVDEETVKSIEYLKDRFVDSLEDFVQTLDNSFLVYDL